MRIRISKENDFLLDKIKALYSFKSEGVVPRIALAISLLSGKKFDFNNEENIGSDGRDFRDDRGLFGTYIGGTSNLIIYKSIVDQHYLKSTFEDEFIKVFKLHLNHGLQIWNENIESMNIAKGEHIDYLIKNIKVGLSLRKKIINTSLIPSRDSSIKEFKDLLKFELGTSNLGEEIEIKLNDLREFDNRNIAIAGMAGSGKTQLVKDILYQISANSNYQLKFIFFDYKGEGNFEQLKSFLDATRCEFVDIVKDGGLKFNPFLSIDLDERQRPFSIRAFVDTISTFVPRMGVSQENILINLIDDLLDKNKNTHPTVSNLFEAIETYYDENNIRQDTLYSVVRDLSTNIFKCEAANPDIFSQSIYLNLPPALSDTLRQLVVFLLLRFFNSHFSSTNDCEPIDNIFPLRYAIVIDEAHIYLKNKNARKALEDLLRLLRSKGVIVMMLSQGVDDYKTKDFDFASQVKLPICLNVQNKDYKSICNFLGTPNSRYKLEAEIKKLESGRGLINLREPKTIELRQWWKTKNEQNL